MLFYYTLGNLTISIFQRELIFYLWYILQKTNKFFIKLCISKVHVYYCSDAHFTMLSRISLLNLSIISGVDPFRFAIQQEHCPKLIIPRLTATIQTTRGVMGMQF